MTNPSTRRRHGGTMAQALAVVVLVAAVGLGGMTRLGGGFRDALADRGTRAPSAAAPVTSQQAANVGDLGHAAEIARGVGRTGETATTLIRDTNFAAGLPAEGSAVWNGYVQQLQRAFAVEDGPGFTILRAREYLPLDAADAFPRVSSGERQLTYDPHYGMNHRLFGENFEAIRDYHNWMGRLMDAALASGRRFEQSNSFINLEGPRSPGFTGWHIDGRAVNTVRVLGGRGTQLAAMGRNEVRAGESVAQAANRFAEELNRGEHVGQGRVSEIDTGDILVFTGRLDPANGPRANVTYRDLMALVHRWPPTDGFRTVLQTRFNFPSLAPGQRFPWRH